MPELNLNSCYRIAGRYPIYIVSFQVFWGKKNRVDVTGYTPKRYKQYLKFYEIEKNWPYKTLAEVEGIKPPKPTQFTFNKSSKIVEIKNTV